MHLHSIVALSPFRECIPPIREPSCVERTRFTDTFAVRVAHQPMLLATDRTVAHVRPLISGGVVAASHLLDEVIGVTIVNTTAEATLPLVAVADHARPAVLTRVLERVRRFCPTALTPPVAEGVLIIEPVSVATLRALFAAVIARVLANIDVVV